LHLLGEHRLLAIDQVTQKINKIVEDSYTSYTFKNDRKLYTFDEDGIRRLVDGVIQECIEACKSRVGSSDYNTGRMHCISDIKEQFGIKQ
jgi:hypothetical protein